LNYLFDKIDSDFEWNKDSIDFTLMCVCFVSEVACSDHQTLREITDSKINLVSTCKMSKFKTLSIFQNKREKQKRNITTQLCNNY